MIQNYINLTRINRPIGIYLLALPCSIIMRSAGCVINDIFDRKFDQKVARTKNRPLASGDLKITQALIVLFALLFFGFLILLQFHFRTIILGVFSLILVALYPFMKRLTFYPQIFLGIIFNCGILLASLEIKGEIAFATIMLYVAAIVWTLIYDTIYAFQDIEDDMKIGVKSSAIALAKNPQHNLSILAIFMGFLLVFAGFLQKSTIFYHLFAILAIIYLLFLIQKCNYKNPQDCLRKFKANVFVGILILIATILG